MQTRKKVKGKFMGEYEIVIGNNTVGGDPDMFAIGFIETPNTTRFTHLSLVDIKDAIHEHEMGCKKSAQTHGKDNSTSIQ